MKPNWNGVYPAVTTNFNEDQSLDLGLFKTNIEKQMEAGVHGIIICGSLGENGTLTTAEKMTLVEASKEAIDGKMPLIMCIAECITSESVAFAQDCEKSGVEGFMLLPSMRYKADDRETLHYLHTVADATDLPVMAYNNPIAYGNFISIDMFKDLAQNAHFEAMKESTGDIRYLTEIINELGDRFKILSGVDNLAMESLIMGADGWVAGLVDAFPRETVVIYELVKQGRIEEAREIYRWFFPLLALDIGNKFVQKIKLAEAAVNMGTEWVREPRLPLVGEERAEVMAIIEKSLANRPVLPQL
ncbi:dihydrodipicolinate synthase family protein [Arcticibacterium luteifluviistationis]|uniref:Dihydrodipicolinate synthase family protein n=1 Tax=Arcticibacterium luteifluviistationis TaxID=1784714 RepID=A0A2Z4GD39_9BACT|nr:dihydrodipicolinate synthase family protein [Arcticibacterium luteifluviistationis]AWV99064.1 dihydrodipicolinate synthase family protein [Arcticibacterium luteifluviistationis]